MSVAGLNRNRSLDSKNGLSLVTLLTVNMLANFSTINFSIFKVSRISLFALFFFHGIAKKLKKRSSWLFLSKKGENFTFEWISRIFVSETGFFTAPNKNLQNFGLRKKRFTVEEFDVSSNKRCAAVIVKRAAARSLLASALRAASIYRELILWWSYNEKSSRIWLITSLRSK